ncbi:MAG: methionine gamma-lyase family protein [Firmicutes bacterium]|nr:methionine gamma-lyase family protein [Bacillota bacterium]
MDKIKIKNLIDNALKNTKKTFAQIDQTALTNQKKVLDAFKKNRIALRHFASTSGYAYGDDGRAALAQTFADVFNTQSAIVSPLFGSGTHTIAAALFGLARPKDTILSISGTPYNTLKKVISGKKGDGSLKDFDIDFEIVDLIKDDKITDGYQFDYQKIADKTKQLNPAIIYIQRAKGYFWRRALSVGQITKVSEFVRKITNAPIVVDNCYGEFVESAEPTDGASGVDLMMGSLIKNPGGGLAPTGGYIVGKTDLIDKIGSRYSAPGVGFDIGANPYGYQYYFQGLFLSPHTVAQSLKTAVLFGDCFDSLGYKVLGIDKNLDKNQTAMQSDITCAIEFKKREELIKFCQAIQSASPIDSHVVPYPSQMPGYECQVIMAAGSFVQGASIELSADAPISPPFVAYLQGGLTLEHGLIALEQVIKSMLNIAN